MPKRESSERARGHGRIDLLLLLILLTALGLRLWGVADRLPDPRVADDPWDDTAVDEGDRRAMMFGWHMWYGGTGALNLNPGTGDWPGLPFYVTLGSQAAYRTYDLLLHPGSDAASFTKRVNERPADMFLSARLFSVALGVLSVFLLYRLGVLVGGRRVGILAAAFLAVMPFHVFSSQRISDPNLLSLVFMTAASIMLVRLVATGAMRDSILAGVWIGLAGASKYLPFVLLVPLVFANAAARREAKGPLVSIRWRPLAAGLAASLLAFALTSPFTFLDWRHKWSDMKGQEARHMAEWAGISAHSRALPTYLVQTLPEMLTGAGYLLALAGCVLLWRRGKAERILVLIPVLFVAGVGTLGLAQPRFVFPAVGILVIACAAAAIAIGDAVATRLTRSGAPASHATSVVFLLFLAGFGVWGVATAASTQRALAKPDSRHVAHAWIRHAFPPDQMMAIDAYGPVFREEASGRRDLAWPFYTSHTDLVRSAFRPEWLDGVRYYLTSSEVSRRFEGSDPRYTAERDFYAWIRGHGVKVWSTDPAATFGPQIDLYELPSHISTTEARDSIWKSERQSSRQGERIVRWTSDLAKDFLVAGNPVKAKEWARRGLELHAGASQRVLTETLSMALIQQGKADEAEATAREGVRLYPRSPLLHLFLAMALEALGRNAEALVEYRVALPLAPNAGARTYVENAIARLGGG